MVEAGIKHRYYRKGNLEYKENSCQKILGLYEGVGLGEVVHLRGRPWLMSRETGLLTCSEAYGHTMIIVSYLIYSLIYKSGYGKTMNQVSLTYRSLTSDSKSILMFCDCFFLSFQDAV